MRRPDTGAPEGAGRRPSGPTRREVVEGLIRELAAAGLESPRTEAERLVASTLGIERSGIATAGALPVSPADAVAIARAVQRRLSGEPIQHIEGSAEFRELVLVSDRRALVPRPETEQLVDLVAGLLEGAAVESALEIGVGSGAIALSLLREGLARRVVGLDISAAALEQARENAARAGVGDALELRLCPPSIWPAVEGEPPFDLVVSNPPYVATNEIGSLAPEVRDHEPREALDGGADGLEVIRAVVSGAAGALRAGGRLVLEIGAQQGERVEALMDADDRWDRVRIDADLARRTRFASARRVGPWPA